ncbi:hypothetical protein LCGC14_1740910, partial [marine sediment metagenome]
MGFWERGFTPKDTEEIRPGLFVKRLKGNKYKQVEPLVWNGKWRLRNQFGWRNILFIVLVFLIITVSIAFDVGISLMTDTPLSIVQEVGIIYKDENSG